MQDLACDQGPPSMTTDKSDPRPVCGARRLSRARPASIQSFTYNGKTMYALFVLFLSFTNNQV